MHYTYIYNIEFNFMLTTISSQAQAILAKDQLRSLSYFELCMLPELILPYLQQQKFNQIKISFCLHLQTFLELNQNFVKYNHSIAQFTKDLQNLKQKPLARQFLTLLNAFLEYSLIQGYQIHQFIFHIENSTELIQILLQKCLINNIILKKSLTKLQKCYLRSIINMVDLVWELHEIKKGNTKFYFALGNRNEPQSLQLQSRIYNDKRKLIQDASQLINDLREQDYLQSMSEYVEFSIGLIKKYEYVVLSQNQKKEKPQSIIPQINSEHFKKDQINMKISQEYYQINSFYIYLTKFKHKQILLTELVLNLLKNINQISEKQLLLVRNTIIFSLEQMDRVLQGSNTTQLINIKSNLFLHSLTLKIVEVKIDKITKSDQFWQKFCQNAIQSFKQIMEYAICNIKISWLFLSALTYLPLELQSVSYIIFQCFNWIIQVYMKAEIKNEEFCYAEYIIFLKQVIAAFKKYNHSQAKLQNSNLIIQKLVLIYKKFGEDNLQAIFSIFNISLLHSIYLIFCPYIRSKAAIETQDFHNESPLQFVNLIKQLKLVELLQQSEAFIYYQRLFECEQVVLNKNDGINELQLNKIGLVLKGVLFERMLKNKNLSLQVSIYLYLEKIKKMIFEISLIDASKKLNDTARNCLTLCLEGMNQKIKCLLLKIVYIQNKKSNQKNISLLDSQEIAIFNNQLENLYFTIVFLLLLIFLSHPNLDQQYFLAALVFKSYLTKQFSEQIFTCTLSYSKKYSINQIQQRNYEEHLAFLRHYQIFEFLYEQLILNTELQLSEKYSKKIKFQQFCKKWCMKQQNYQWLSEQKLFKISLISLQKYSLALLSKISSQKSE